MSVKTWQISAKLHFSSWSECRFVRVKFYSTRCG